MPLSTPARNAVLSCLLLGSSLLGGCSLVSRTMSDGLTSVITPYRVEIVQGNVITSEQIAQIKPGRSRNEVRDILGSPLLADPFHAQRWDYFFALRRPGTEPQKRSVVVLFEGDVVKSVEAPDLPSEREFIAAITRGKAEESKRKLELTAEERAALPVPAATAASASSAAPQGAVRSYPPLESL
jgi:outer membrane protein assembly factor BamE